MSKNRLILTYYKFNRDPNQCDSNLDFDCPTPTTPTPTVETPTPTPAPGFPVTFTLENFSGYAENCSNYNGTYVLHQPYIDGNPAAYNYSVPPPNNYATAASVDVGYSPNAPDNVFVCINLTTPDGSFQQCAGFVDWNTGNNPGGGISAWCEGEISFIIST